MTVRELRSIIAMFPDKTEVRLGGLPVSTLISKFLSTEEDVVINQIEMFDEDTGKTYIDLG